MKVEVFIQGERLDLYDDESINVKQVTQDLKDISKIFSDYSQTFTIPASRRNNLILKSWFNADIDNGFDARTRVQATITINTLDFKHGKIRLDGANIENNVPVNYKLTFFGNVIKIKDLLGEDELNDLDWLDNFNHSYDGDVVKQGLTTGINFTVDGENFSNAILYPLISYNRQWYYNSNNSDTTNTEQLVNIAYNNNNIGIISGNLKPAIKLNLVIRAIQEKYGLNFNSPFFDSAVWNSIYINLNKETTNLANGSVVYEDISGQYDDGNLAKNTYAYKYTTTITPNSGYESTPYKVKITFEDEVIYESPNYVIGDRVIVATQDYQLDYRFRAEIITQTSFVFDATTSLEASYFIFNGLSTITGDDLVYSNTYIGESVDIITNITNELPEIKVYEFLTNIFKTFNLIATADGDDIYIQALQDWYAEGNIYDVTNWIDLKSEKIQRGKIYKDIQFKFKESDQILWDEFNQSNNQGYGELEFRLSSLDSLQDIDGETLEIESIFENPIHTRLFDLDNNTETTLLYCPYFNREIKPISGNAFMFFGTKNSVNSNSISFINDGVEEELNGSIFMPSHSYVINSDSFNLNFNAEVNEYTSSVMQDTIYKQYWDDYITDMFSIKRRIYTIEAVFPDYFLNRLKLNDRLIIKDRRYIINSISSNLTKRKDTLELVNDIYDAPLASDRLKNSIFERPFGVYSNIENQYSIRYIGITGQNIDVIDLGDGVSFLGTVEKETVGSVTAINFLLEYNNTGVTRTAGIQVTDGLNNPTFIVIQNSNGVTADNSVITADSTIITADRNG